MPTTALDDPDLADALAIETLRQLAQEPRVNLTPARCYLQILNQMDDTPMKCLLETLEADANQIGLHLCRTWRGLQYGGQATHTLYRGTTALASCTFDGNEGKTPRSKSYQLIAELGKTIAAHEPPLPKQRPTCPLYGDYLLGEAQINQVLDLGAIYHRKQSVWLSPEAARDQVKSILLSRIYAYLGEIDVYQQEALKSLLPKGDYHLTNTTDASNRFCTIAFVVASRATQAHTILRLALKT